jgi:glutathione synthase/RimK-type ligase-like ATP-grasp enzyme
MSDSAVRADILNRECECVGTDVPALQRRLDIGETHPHLFADVPVFLAAGHARQMQRVISAVDTVTRLPAFREQVLAGAPVIARKAPASRGVFFGFDFHIAPDGVKLIEINTNAGGALLNVEMLRTQQICCAPAGDYLRSAPSAEMHESTIVDMFMREWRSSRSHLALRTIAIVDDAPREQYLFPEFLLFQKLFEARGIRTLIVDARDLAVDEDSLTYQGERIDLVYNRSTDFYFAAASHAALAEAYARDLAVITPHPHAHALYSDKKNLVLLSDGATLRKMGATETVAELLASAIPRTLLVAGPEQRWWDERKQWFFKPAHGFGSRGTYRGDKITRRAHRDVMDGNYIAQQLAPPSERHRKGGLGSFKLDVRSYVYEGVQQLLAVRLYQGQTTNFRSAGGGFAPVYIVQADQDPGTSPRG